MLGKRRHFVNELRNELEEGIHVQEVELVDFEVLAIPFLSHGF